MCIADGRGCPRIIRSVSTPEGFVELREPRGIGWLRKDLADLGLGAMWAALTAWPGAKGRGGIGQLQLQPDLVAVVRPFRRGGAFGKLLGERYARPARVRHELEVLQRLRLEGVPVVSPLAAVARKHRAFWRLRLLTQLEPDAQPLLAFCSAHPELRRWAVEAAAVTVRLAFAAGLRHPDLHADNVLLAAHGERVRAVLVDLDRAHMHKPVGEQSRDQMLVRMARYLRRHASRIEVAPSCTDHLRFLRGLGLDRDQRRNAWGRLARRLQRQVRRHQLAWPKADG
jgi:Lipopolysaccharide kinase (Kdo/WaaP) family